MGGGRGQQQQDAGGGDDGGGWAVAASSTSPAGACHTTCMAEALASAAHHTSPSAAAITTSSSPAEASSSDPTTCDMSIKMSGVYIETSPTRTNKQPAQVRSHSLDQLNFQEKRQIIASTLSLSEFLGGAPQKAGKLKVEVEAGSDATSGVTTTTTTASIVTKTASLSLSDIINATKSNKGENLVLLSEGELLLPCSLSAGEKTVLDIQNYC